MTNEVKWQYGSEIVLEASGASAASGAFVAANDTTLGTANHLNYPLADFVLAVGFGGAVAAGKCIYLYRQDLDIDGTNDAPAPSASYKSKLVGIFEIPSAATSTVGYYPVNDVPLTANCQFSLENGTDQSISAGWTLKVKPKTYVPGA